MHIIKIPSIYRMAIRDVDLGSLRYLTTPESRAANDNTLCTALFDSCIIVEVQGVAGVRGIREVSTG